MRKQSTDHTLAATSRRAAMTRNLQQVVMFMLCICAIGCDRVRPVATPNAPSTTSAPKDQRQSITEDRADAEPLTTADLNERQVIGQLGVPLGTVVEIKGAVVSGDDLRKKLYQGAYLLRVTEVDGRALESPPVITFFVPGFSGVKLASNNRELYEMKVGATARELSTDQRERLRKNYVGKQMRLVVYEVGRYSGMPTKLPDDVLIWQDVGFGFRTSLNVLKAR